MIFLHSGLHFVNKRINFLFVIFLLFFLKLTSFPTFMRFLHNKSVILLNFLIEFLVSGQIVILWDVLILVIRRWMTDIWRKKRLKLEIMFTYLIDHRNPAWFDWSQSNPHIEFWSHNCGKLVHKYLTFLNPQFTNWFAPWTDPWFLKGFEANLIPLFFHGDVFCLFYAYAFCRVFSHIYQ